MYQLDFTPLENLYQNTFKNIKKIYYQNFFGNIMDDLSVKVTADVTFSEEGYEKTGFHVAHADAIKTDVFQPNKLSVESIRWLSRLTKTLCYVWMIVMIIHICIC